MPRTMRKGFSMFTAIIVIVLMATVGIYVMDLSGRMVTQTTAQYQREQAILYANSYTEYAILAVMANNRGIPNNCLQTIQGTNLNGENYNVTVNIQYIGTNAALGDCLGAPTLAGGIQNPNTPLSILVDVSVTYPDIDNPNGTTRTYFKRTLQKI
jgi:uncharacterized protein (UPF0333 family)